MNVNTAVIVTTCVNHGKARAWYRGPRARSTTMANSAKDVRKQLIQNHKYYKKIIPFVAYYVIIHIILICFLVLSV